MYVIFASQNHFVICVSSSKHPITLLQNYLLSNSYHTSFVLHFWILNMGVLIIQKKCFLKSFLKPDWRACWYCSNISRAQLPETQHMSPNLPQQPQGFGGFHIKFFCIFTQKNNHTPLLQLDCILLLSLERGQSLQSCEPARCISVTTLNKDQFSPRVTILWRGTTIQEERKHFPEPVVGIHKDGTENEIVTEQNLKTTDEKGCVTFCLLGKARWCPILLWAVSCG